MTVLLITLGVQPPKHVTDWADELKKFASTQKAKRADEPYEQKPKPVETVPLKDWRPGKRQALCDAFHIVDRALAELDPASATKVKRHLELLGYENYGRTFDQSALAHYLRARVRTCLPERLPVPTVYVDGKSVLLKFDEYGARLLIDLPAGPCRYQVMYGLDVVDPVW